jgi:hypothetical protein
MHFVRAVPPPLSCLRVISQGVTWKTLQLGEVVDANRMASTPFQLNFVIERKDETVCTKTLTAEELSTFRKVSTAGELSVPSEAASGRGT